MAIRDDWAPDACTLPTAQRPLRVAAFDDLFTAVRRWQRPQPTRLDLVLPRAVEAAGRDLARRESECCSFFTFEFESVGDDVVMHIAVPPEHVGVLDALQARNRTAN
jgi:hypothetical protein